MRLLFSLAPGLLPYAAAGLAAQVNTAAAVECTAAYQSLLPGHDIATPCPF